MFRTITAALALALLFAMPLVAQTDSSREEIRVSGAGKVPAAVDSVTLSAGVMTEAAGADDAVAENNAIMAGVIAAIKDAGVPSADIKTVNFSVYARYNNQGVSNGFRVNNSVEVITRNVDEVGLLLDLIVSAGANRLGGISFGIDQDSGLRRQALELAVEDARQKALALASAAGVTLGEPVRIAEHSQSVGYYAGNDFSTRPSAVPVEAGQNFVHAKVDVRYAIDGGAN